MKIECIMNNDHYHKINIKKSDLFPLFWSLHNDLHGIDHGIKTSGAENETVPQYYINIHVNHDFHILTWPWQVMKDSMIRSFSWFEPANSNSRHAQSGQWCYTICASSTRPSSWGPGLDRAVGTVPRTSSTSATAVYRYDINCKVRLCKLSHFQGR